MPKHIYVAIGVLAFAIDHTIGGLGLQPDEEKSSIIESAESTNRSPWRARTTLSSRASPPVRAPFFLLHRQK